MISRITSSVENFKVMIAISTLLIIKISGSPKITKKIKNSLRKIRKILSRDNRVIKIKMREESQVQKSLP